MSDSVQMRISDAVAAACQQLFAVAVKPVLDRPDEQFGDITCNVALQLSKQLGRNPREIGEALAADLRERLADIVQEVAIAGPGFINLRLSNKALYALADQQTTPTLTGKTVVAEYSDPNPFKPLHAGHLYTTLVGDMIARLAEVAGAKVVRVNYGGDVGLHVAKCMWAICQHLGGELPDKLAAIPEQDRPAWLGERYVEGNNAYEDGEAEQKAAIIAMNKQVYALHSQQDHDSDLARIYWTCRQWSYDYFAVLYTQLQVKPFDRYIPESEVTPLGLATVQQQLEQGVYTMSNKAVIFDGEAVGLHSRVFINSEGLPTYEAKEVGLSLTKWRDYAFDESIIITANEQQQYMQVVLASIARFEPEAAARTRHLVHGVVKLQGGKKMSSRKGNVVTALQILEEARQAGQETGTSPAENTIIAAVKYAFAKNRIGTDIAYDPRESIALEGNSGPYLQYAHARACSIARKAGDGAPLSVDGEVTLEADERSLLRKVAEYAEVVDHSVAELMPHHICTYLYELAQVFNRFYEHNQVIGHERQAVRLDLVNRYTDRLRQGLELLGIDAPETI